MSFYDKFSQPDPVSIDPYNGIGKSVEPVNERNNIKGLYVVPGAGTSACPQHLCMSEVTAADIADTVGRFGETTVQIGTTIVYGSRRGFMVNGNAVVNGKAVDADFVNFALANAVTMARQHLA